MGIDYGLGRTNRDPETGIRFGVIPMDDVTQAWADSSESDYGSPSCEECGNEAVQIDELPFDLDACKTIRREQTKWYSSREVDILAVPEEYQDDYGEEWKDEGRDFACPHCSRSFDGDDAYGGDPICFNLDDGEYQAYQSGDDCDIFIFQSPYYTYGPFCSPCAPGAVYLRDGDTGGDAKAYCFAPDWFDAYAGDTGEYNGAKTSCPYPVFRVADDVCVFAPNKTE